MAESISQTTFVDKDYIEINLDLHDKERANQDAENYTLIQGNHNSRIIRCYLTKNFGLTPVDLSNSTLILYIKKADLALVMLSGQIVDAKNGIVDFLLTQQALAVTDKIVCEVIKTGVDKSTMSFPNFTLKIDSTIVDEELVESSNEFSALIDALANINKWDMELTEKYNTSLEKDIVVKGVTVGNLKDGDVLPKGMTFTQFIERILVRQIMPTYAKPTLGVLSSVGLKLELGKTINPTITANYIKNDGGEIISYKLFKNNTMVKNSTTIEGYSEQFVLNGSIQYRAEVSYEAGEIKNDNLGNSFPEEQIQAGTISSEITIVGARAFWGYSSETGAIPDTQGIRGTDISGIDLKEGSTIKVVAQPTDRMVVFAYPATLKDCAKIRYEEWGDNTNKTAFKQTTVSVPNANGMNPINYRVYYYISPVPFDSTATFILTV